MSPTRDAFLVAAILNMAPWYNGGSGTIGRHTFG
jgi:hypothetical protein